MKKFIVLLSLLFCLAGSIVSYAGVWIQDSQGWRYMDDNGAILADVSFQDPTNNRIYHFNSDGYMCTGIVNIKDKNYYFGHDGALQLNGKTDDGHLVDGKGQVIDDANDGYTLIISSMTENKVGYSKLAVVSIKNECDKPFTIRPTCGILNGESKKTLYLFNSETHTFDDQRIINPGETLSLSFIDSDMSEFYVDQNSRIEMYFIFDDKDFSASLLLGKPNRGNFSDEYIKNEPLSQ